MYPAYQNRIRTRLNITPGGYFVMGLVCMSMAALMGV